MCAHTFPRTLRRAGNVICFVVLMTSCALRVRNGRPQRASSHNSYELHSSAMYISA